MSGKLLKILIISLFVFSTVIIKQRVVIDNYNIAFAQDQDEQKKEIDYTKYCWNLYSLYKSDELWEKDLKKFNRDIKELENYVGKITKSKTHLSFGLGIKEKLDTRLNSLSAYAKLKRDLNKNSYEYLNMNEEINKAYSRYSKITSQLDFLSIFLNNSYTLLGIPLIDDTLDNIFSLLSSK